VNRWLGRAPRSRDEVLRLQACCDSPDQCVHCPLRAENAGRSIADITKGLLEEWD
jgi:hypothetical protein